MRSLSLALVIALLVCPCVIATTPMPPKGDQPAGLSLPSEGALGNQEKGSVEGEQRASTPESQAGSVHSSNAPSDTTLGAHNFDPNDIDRSQSGWARMKTKHSVSDLILDLNAVLQHIFYRTAFCATYRTPHLVKNIYRI